MISFYIIWNKKKLFISKKNTIILLVPWAKCSRDIDIKYPSSDICLLFENRPTNASNTLLLAVAPPAHKSPRRLYEETFEFHTPRRNDIVPLGPHLRNAAFILKSQIYLLKYFWLARYTNKPSKISINLLAPVHALSTAVRQVQDHAKLTVHDINLTKAMTYSEILEYFWPTYN